MEVLVHPRGIPMVLLVRLRVEVQVVMVLGLQVSYS